MGHASARSERGGRDVVWGDALYQLKYRLSVLRALATMVDGNATRNWPRDTHKDEIVRIFMYEHTCAMVHRKSIPRSLAREGGAMARAVVRDLADLPGCRVVVCGCEKAARRRSRTAIWDIGPQVDAEYVPAADFDRLARECDYTLIIAPEFGRILERLCRRVEMVGGKLFGPSSPAVFLTSDKLACARQLSRAGVPTPACAPLRRGVVAPAFGFPSVVKPRDGAGSQSVRLLRNRTAWCGWARTRGKGQGSWILQRFVPGLAASVAVLVGRRESVALPAGTQRLSSDGRFRYLGGCVPLPGPLNERAQALARRAVASIPGLLGYVGVDLVLGAETDGSGDRVIEINPRLTTSYIGLRALSQTNLMGACLEIVRGEPRASLTWRRGSARFTPDGRILQADAAGQAPP